MKKFAVALLCLSLFSFAGFSQSGRTSRPRIVTTPTPNDNQSDSTQDSNTTNQNQTKRPPVLIGDKNPSNSNGSTTQPTDSTVTSVEDDEVIRVETNLVTIPVTVLDRNGRFVAGLRQTDFQIFEDGAPQKIEYFAPVEQPFTVVLMLDVSPSTQFKIDEIQNAAITFVNQLQAGDKVIVMSFDERVQVLSPPTNNRAVLRDAIRQTGFGEGTSLYEAVDYAISRELRRIEGRKAVVLFTDGVDTTSRRASYQSTVRAAEELDALIYPIRYDTLSDIQSQTGNTNPFPRNSGGGVLGTILGGILGGGNIRIGGGGGGSGNNGTRAEYERGRRYLEDLARTTGGRAFEARSMNNLDAAFSGIAEELRRQYSIGYYPETIGQTGQRKQIKVRTNRQDAIVRAKNSYIVGEMEAKANTKSNTKQPPRITSRLPF